MFILIIMDSELWMRKSASDIIPIHTLVGKLGATKDVLLAAHFITGSDVTSRIGTKLSALKAQPEKRLSKFGQHLPPTTQSFKLAGEYLVKVLEPKSKCKTLDDLQCEKWLKPSFQIYKVCLAQALLCTVT